MPDFLTFLLLLFGVLLLRDLKHTELPKRKLKDHMVESVALETVDKDSISLSLNSECVSSTSPTLSRRILVPLQSNRRKLLSKKLRPSGLRLRSYESFRSVSQRSVSRSSTFRDFRAVQKTEERKKINYDKAASCCSDMCKGF